MNSPSPDLFFSLRKFKHRSLWKEGEPVWSALHSLSKYLETLRFKIEIDSLVGVHLERPELISIGPGTVIEPGVMIQGPCVIGSRCIIRQGAYLREGTILGDGCIVGHSAELKQSILLDGAAATHFVYVGDSILGNEVNLGAGVKCANLRLDRKNVQIHWENSVLKTGLKKFGAIVGDRAQIGCNSVLNPGTLIGKGALCHPLVTLSGYVPAGSLVKSDRSMQIESSGKRLLEKIGRS